MRCLLICGGLFVAVFGVPAWHPEPAPDRPVPSYIPPKGYVCHRAAGPIKVDGKLDEAAWQAAPWTDDFVDIEGDAKPKPQFRTRAKMLWDDEYFYIGAELQEPHICGTIAERDAVIFHDNDFEVFIDPDGDNHEYGEFEMNALNTVWDLLLTRPYKDGGRAINGWDIAGLKTGVHVEGTLNNPADIDRGWTVEIALPWKALGELARQPKPGEPERKFGLPRDGDQWRVNFSRVEWKHEIVDGKYRKIKGVPEDNWVWSPQGVIDMHRPETWGYVQFSTGKVGDVAFRPDPAGPAKYLLHQIYYAQREYRKIHDRWAPTLADLGLAKLNHVSLVKPPLLETTSSLFEATAEIKQPDGSAQRWHIRQDSRIWEE